MDPVTAIVTKCHALHLVEQARPCASLRIKSRLYGPAHWGLDVARRRGPTTSQENHRWLAPYPPLPPGGAEGRPFPVGRAYGEPYPYPAGYRVRCRRRSTTPHLRPHRRGEGRCGDTARAGSHRGPVAVAVPAGGRGSGRGAGAFNEADAKKAIQSYLTALSDQDNEVIARNNLCGMFDAIMDRKSDMALARLASDAFRKQFAQAEVTSIDKIVLSSSYQAQVLFTMRVQPATTSRKSARGGAGRGAVAATGTISCWCARTCCGPLPSTERSEGLSQLQY